VAVDDARSGAASIPTRGASAEILRPAFVALLESQPLPAFAYGPGGVQVLHNAAAAHLLTPSPEGVDRVLAQDGTELWTIIAARSDEANPFFDIRLRLREVGGESVEATMMAIPIRGPGGTLGGAVVFVLSVPTERLRSADSAAGSTAHDFMGIVARVGELVGAAGTFIVEVDREYSDEARILAVWDPGNLSAPFDAFKLRGTPTDAFAGRKTICVPSGLVSVYPGTMLAEEEGLEAYVGVALTDAEGSQIGVLGGVWREPLTDPAGIAAVFSMMAIPATDALVELVADRELRESEQRYGSVFEGSAVPILLVEPTTTQIVDANPAACLFYGYDHDELLSMSVVQVDVLSAEHAKAEIDRAVEGSRRSFIGRHLLSGGRVRDVEVSIGPVAVSGRRLLYLMVNDITERKRMESEIERNRANLERVVGQRTEDLLRANAELQQASMARDMVFVNLAQELHTSLQTITGFSNLLLEGQAGALTDEQGRQLAMIQQAGKRLATFSATLLESHRLEEADALPESEQFDLVGLAESVLFGLASFAEAKNLKLEFTAEERPIQVTTDRYRLQQVLLNLLSNAIRYTERGGVTVTITADDEDYCSIAVTDSGPGLSSDRIETLFDGPEVHDSAAGIGLPASQRIAGMLGGVISVESVQGRGSVFTLRVPRVYANAADGNGE
jgi:PAS domain S-box-containing protein